MLAIRARFRYTRIMVAPQTEVLITVAGSETGHFVFGPGDYIIGRNPGCHTRRTGRSTGVPFQKTCVHFRTRAQRPPMFRVEYPERRARYPPHPRESQTLQSTLLNFNADAYPGEAHTGPRPVAEFWKAYDAH